MTDPDLHVSMETGIAAVGGRFRGRIVRSGELDDLIDDPKQPVRAVRVSLRYYTEGRGGRDSKAVARNEFPVDDYGRLDAGFELAIPEGGPISYDGRLIRIIWEVEARLDIKRRVDVTTIIPVLVIPTNGWGLYDRPHPLPR